MATKSLTDFTNGSLCHALNPLSWRGNFRDRLEYLRFTKFNVLLLGPPIVSLFSLAKIPVCSNNSKSSEHIKGIHLHSQFSHNHLTMWEEFRSHCDSQYQMTSEFFSQYLHILASIFQERRNSSAKKTVPWKKHRENVNFGPISKKFIFSKWK